jgi:hypothetical protein
MARIRIDYCTNISLQQKPKALIRLLTSPPSAHFQIR